MIRFIIIVLIVLLYLILGIPVLLIEWVIGKINRRARDYSSLRLVQAAFKLIMFATGYVRIRYVLVLMTIRMFLVSLAVLVTAAVIWPMMGI